MPARSEWKGFLQINQLRVPVKAFSAAASTPEISLNQLHRNCGKRIRQQRFCPIHGPVETENIIPGYRVADDCYLPLEPGDLEQLKPDPDKTIAVDCFVDQQTIDPMFHTGRTLYLVPDGPPGQRPFGVLREGMKATGRQAFSRVVMARRELLVVLRPFGRLLAMTIVEYPHRVRPAADYESEVASVTPAERELELIQQLIETLTNPQFELSRYRDRYMDALNTLIEERIAAADMTSESPFSQNGENEGQAATVDDALVAVLEASLTEAGVDHSLPPALRSGLSVPQAGEGQPEQKLA